MHYNLCVSLSVATSVHSQLMKMPIALKQHGIFYLILNHSAGNDQITFHTFPLALDIGKIENTR